MKKFLAASAVAVAAIIGLSGCSEFQEEVRQAEKEIEQAEKEQAKKEAAEKREAAKPKTPQQIAEETAPGASDLRIKIDGSKMTAVHEETSDAKHAQRQAVDLVSAAQDTKGVKQLRVVANATLVDAYGQESTEQVVNLEYPDVSKFNMDNVDFTKMFALSDQDTRVTHPALFGL